MEESNVKNNYILPEILVVELSTETVIATSGTGSFEDFGTDIFKF